MLLDVVLVIENLSNVSKTEYIFKEIIVKTIQSLSSVRISNIISFFHVKTFFISQHSRCSSHDIQHFLEDVLHLHHTMALGIKP